MTCFLKRDRLSYATFNNLELNRRKCEIGCGQRFGRGRWRVLAHSVLGKVGQSTAGTRSEHSMLKNSPLSHLPLPLLLQNGRYPFFCALKPGKEQATSAGQVSKRSSKQRPKNIVFAGFEHHQKGKRKKSASKQYEIIPSSRANDSKSKKTPWCIHTKIEWVSSPPKGFVTRSRLSFPLRMGLRVC